MESKFTGDLWGWIGIKLLEALISIVSLGIAMPWAVCMRMRWYAKHTIVDGKQLVFDGKGIQLFGWCLGEFLLSLIPAGVYIVCKLLLDLDVLLWVLAVWVASIPWFLYVLYLPIRLQKWGVKHTHTESCNDNDCWENNRGYAENASIEREGCPYYGYNNYQGYGNYRRPDYYRGPDNYSCPGNSRRYYN